MKFIQLTNTYKLAIVDNEDYPELVKSRWWLSPGGYAVSKARYKSNLMHRVIMKPSSEDYVDHKNRLKLDNRKSNLRICDQSYNLANAKIARNNSSGYKGVSLSKAEGKYKAYICRKGVKYNLGTYPTAEQASEAYKTKAEELFGEYARFE